MNIRAGQLWANRTRNTTIEVLHSDHKRPGRWLVLLHRSEATVSFGEDDITSRYQLMFGGGEVD